MVGTVDRISPICSLYRMVVFPAASKPSMTTCARLAWLCFMPPGLIMPWEQMPGEDSHPHLPVAK